MVVMEKIMKKLLLAAAAVCAMSGAALSAQTAAIAANEKVEKVEAITSIADTKGTKLYVVGDSTYSSFNDPYYYPRYGIGTKLQQYLNEDKIEVINLAMSGRSSKSFTTEANYQTLKNSIKKGDYLIIGFGHNDEKTEEARYTNPNGSKEEAGSFKNSLYENYIKLAQSVKATPILATPIVRRAPGKAYEGAYVHSTADVQGFPGGDYAKAIRELGNETGTLVIDNTSYTKDLYEKLGDDETVNLHAWLGHKSGSVDNTHLNAYGASVLAYHVVNEIASSNKKFGKLVAKKVAEPVKVLILEPNPSYVIPTYEQFTADKKSSNFETTAPWFGTVFGDCGGAEKISNPEIFEIVENGKTVNMHSGSKDTKTSAGKIAAGSDGIAMYFQQIPADKDFTFTATAKVNGVAKNNQVSFGLMVRDDIHIDKYDNTIKSDYVACGPLKITKGDEFSSSYARKDGSLVETKNEGEAVPSSGTTVKLLITKSGNTYTVKYGNCPEATYEAKLTEVDSDYVYAGLYTVRAAYVDFSDIKILVK